MDDFSSHFRTSKHSDHFDHVHAAAYNIDEERIDPITGFDYDALDAHVADDMPAPDEQISWADLVASFSLVLQWVCHSPDIRTTGARAHSLLVLLNPVQGHYKTLADVARAAGCSRAALSKALLRLKDDCGFNLAMKNENSRVNSRRAQIACLERGTHASCVKARKRAEAEAVRLDAVAE